MHRSLPIYSGGLGALAGDILKEASDRALPLVAVGLMYRQGYFRQRIDAGGWQHEYWVDTDPERAPRRARHAATTASRSRSPCPCAGCEVSRRSGASTSAACRSTCSTRSGRRTTSRRSWITSRLYIGEPDARLAQYVLLGVGGVRALAAMGIEPGLLHLNEGHARVHLARGGARPRRRARRRASRPSRARTIFTTHTPVPAGNDTYPAGQVVEALGGLTASMGVDPMEVIRLGRTRPDDDGEPFGVSQFALRTSRAANGVSRRHGEVARAHVAATCGPARALDDVPIGHVTNGVHIPTWIGGPMRELLDRHLGDGWLDRAADPATWAGVDDIPDEELWAVRAEQRAALVDYVRDQERRSTGSGATSRAATPRPPPTPFDPDALTIGFARRLATYKRLHLLVQDADRALALLGDDRPVQLVLAGKAHPRDDEGKRLVQHLFTFKWAPEIGGRVVYLDDYDLSSAARMVRGCDVWVNLPRPPLEASGTSGMKSAVNGGLQLSVLDGWWAEGYDGENGWALPGDEDPDHGAQDHRDGAELHRLLEEEVSREFYDRDAAGIPRAWLARVRARSRRTARSSRRRAWCATTRSASGAAPRRFGSRRDRGDRRAAELGLRDETRERRSARGAARSQPRRGWR